MFYTSPPLAYLETFEPQNPITSYTGRDVTSQAPDRQTSESSTIKDSDSERGAEETVTKNGVKLRKRRSKSSDNVSYERRVDSAPPLSFDSTSSCADVQYSYIEPNNNHFSAPIPHRSSQGKIKSNVTTIDTDTNATTTRNIIGRSTPHILVTKTYPSESTLNHRATLENMASIGRSSSQSHSHGGQGVRSERLRDHELMKSSPTSPETEQSSPFTRDGSISSQTSDSQPVTYGEARSKSRLRSDNYMRYLSASRSSLNASRTSLNHSRESVNSISDQTPPVPPFPSNVSRRPNLKTLGKSQSLDNPNYQERVEHNVVPSRVEVDTKMYKPTLQPTAAVSNAAKPQQQKLGKKLGTNFAPLPNRIPSSSPSTNPAVPASTSRRMPSMSVHNAVVHRDASPKTAVSTTAIATGGKTAPPRSTSTDVVSTQKHSKPSQNENPLHATLPLHDNPLAMSREREREAAVAASVLLGVKLSTSESDLLSRLAMEENPQASYLKRKMREDIIPPLPKKERERSKERHKRKKKSKESISVEKKDRREKSRDRGNIKSPKTERTVRVTNTEVGPKGDENNSNSSNRTSRSRTIKGLFRQDSDTSNSGKSSKREKISGFFGSVIERGKKAFHRDTKKDRLQSDDSILSDNVFTEPSPRPSPKVQHTGVQTSPQTPETSMCSCGTPDSKGTPTTGYESSEGQSPGSMQSAREPTADRSRVDLAKTDHQIRSRTNSSSGVRTPVKTGNDSQGVPTPTFGKLPKAAVRRQFFASMKSSSLGRESTSSRDEKSPISLASPLVFSDQHPLSQQSGSGSGKDKSPQGTEPIVTRYFETEIDTVGDVVITQSYESSKRTPQTNKHNSINSRRDGDKRQRDEILLDYYKREQTPNGVGVKAGGTVPNGHTVYTEQPLSNKRGYNSSSTKGAQGSSHNITNKNKDIGISAKANHNNRTRDQVADTELLVDAKVRTTDYKVYGAATQSTQYSKTGNNPGFDSVGPSPNGHDPTGSEKWYDEILQRQRQRQLTKQTTEESETTTVSEISESEYYDSPRESPSVKSSQQLTSKDRVVANGHQHRIVSGDSGSETSYISAESVVDPSYIQEQNKLLSALQSTAKKHKRKGKRKLNKAQSFDSTEIDSFVSNVVESEHTRLLREKLREKKHSSDTDEGIVKDKMEQLKRPLNMDIDEAKLQEALSSPGDSALGTPSSSVVSNMKVDENALDDIQQELAQAIREEKRKQKGILSRQELEAKTNSFPAGNTPSPNPSKEGNDGRGRNNLEQDTYLMYSINDKGAKRNVSKGDKGGDLVGYEYIPDEDKNVPHMDYVPKVNLAAASEVREVPGFAKTSQQKSSLSVPGTDTPSVSSFNEISKGVPSSESSSKEFNEMSNARPQKDLSQATSPSRKKEGEKPNYDTYDIEEESALTSMDKVVMGAILTNKAKHKFLKMLDPKPKPYEPIFNTRAHPYKNLRQDEDQTNLTKNTPTQEEEKEGPEDPEAEGYEPTNMLRELVLLKSAGFDLNDEKVKQFIDLKNELDDNKEADENKTDKNDALKQEDDSSKEDDNKKNDNQMAPKNMAKESGVQDDNKSPEANRTVETILKVEIYRYNKTEVTHIDNRSGVKTNNVSASNKNEEEERKVVPAENTIEKEYLSSLIAENGQVSANNDKDETVHTSENNGQNHSESSGEKSVNIGLDTSYLAVKLEKKYKNSVAQTSPEENKKLSESSLKADESNPESPSELCNDSGKRVKLERHVSFSDDSPAVFEVDSSVPQAEGTSQDSVNRKQRQVGPSSDETDEPVFVVSSFDTFLQQLYVNMGMYPVHFIKI